MGKAERDAMRTSPFESEPQIGRRRRCRKKDGKRHAHSALVGSDCTARVRVKRSGKLGRPWLGLELMRRLELDRFLEQPQPEGCGQIPSPSRATVLAPGRLCDPSSGLHLAEEI